MLVQSFEYFMYEIEPAENGNFNVRPAYGHHTQWGESWDDEWEITLEEVLRFYDVQEDELLKLHS